MEINYISILLAALSAFVLGFVWYTLIFNKVWQRLIGMNSQGENTKKLSLGKFLLGSFVIELIMAFNLYLFIGPNADWILGLVAGLAAGFGWVSLAFAVNYMFEGKSFKLWLINAGYNTLVFGVMGLIIGAF